MFIVYIFNNKILEKKKTIKTFSQDNYGLKKIFNNLILKRFEVENFFYLNNFSMEEFNSFLKLIYFIIPKNLDIFSKQILNIWVLNNINSYRGWRHSLGLPVRGQRTWSNGNNSFNSNNILRDFKLTFFKKFYGNIPLKQINIGIIAEQLNFMWKYQWNIEWTLSKNSILKQINKLNSIKIDLFSMYNFQIMHPKKLKKLSKKQKQSFKKNHFSLGFEIGFSRPLLRSYNKLDTEDTNKYSNASLILKNEKQSKKKINKQKKTNIKKVVKKKKSVWDF